MTVLPEQEELLSKLAIAYYKHQKDLNIQIYLEKKAEESGNDRAKEHFREERRLRLAKMEAILEFGEDHLITDYQITKEVLVIKENEKKTDAIVEDGIVKHEERMRELGIIK